MQVDYLIVGQGIAGTVLSYALLKRGKSILVLDDKRPESASGVAAGIVNPITGRRLTKTWEADQIFPFLRNFYREMEAAWQQSFFYEKDVLHPFISVEEQNTWLARTAAPHLAAYVDTQPDLRAYQSAMPLPFGGMLIRQAGYVNVTDLLEAHRNELQKSGAYRQVTFRYPDLQLLTNGVQWQDVRAKKILFCDGTHYAENPYFQWLPFQPVKGEMLLVRMPDFPEEYLINRGIFVLPVGNGVFKVGATYSWDDLEWQITAPAGQELTDKLRNLVRTAFSVLNQQVGIRPATADRRPFIGLHPKQPEIGIFSGFGSKGVSLAPYFAEQFVGYLESNKELQPEVQIERFFSLYYKFNT